MIRACVREGDPLSYIRYDRNLEQILVPITILRGGTSRSFFFERCTVPKPGEGLEVFLLSPYFTSGKL